MKKIFIPTALTLLLTTGLIASEVHQANKPAITTDKVVTENEVKHPTDTKESHIEAAHPVADKVVKAGKKVVQVAKNAVNKIHKRRHSVVDIKLADDITDRLNKMTCTKSVVTVDTESSSAVVEPASC